jgi:U3 small nucleolar RNA-associated protein 22
MQSAGMSSMHLFRTTLMALHHPKTFAKDTLAMQRSSTSLSSLPPPPLKAYRTSGLNEVMFLDSTGWINLANYVSSAALKTAQICAKRTAVLLSVSAGPDAFDAAFLAGYPLSSLYDVWYKVTIPASKKEETSAVIQPKSAEKTATRASKKKKTAAAAAAAAEVLGSDCFARDVPEWLQMDKKAVEIAAKALGTRATLVRAIHRGCTRSTDTHNKTKEEEDGGDSCFQFSPSSEYSLIAARLDPTHALRGVDIGPAADSGAPAAQFRAFWGEKSELRRFQDGKISEAVVWETAPSQRHLIVDNVVEYALQRHLPVGTRVSRCSGLLDKALQRKNSTADDDVAATRLVEAAAARLGKRLRTLDGLPLQIVGTQPLAPVLRHADVFPPQPHLLAGAAHTDLTDETSSSIPRCLPAVELLCQLEGSGKWPDGPAAFAKMKAAVGVQLAQTLHSGFGIEAAAAEDYVDILTDGFAFRLILHTERDIVMQQMALTASGMPHLPPEEDIALRMWHHGAISAAAAANPAFEPSVRLAKRWIASQWLSPHFRDEAIELLVAAAFAAGESVIAPPPGSRVSGFLRFLHVLGTHPWAAAPLVGDIAAGDPGPARREVSARAHAAQRATEMGAPAMFITGPKDDECIGWTREHPTRAMLHRASVLARRAVQTLENTLIPTQNLRDNHSTTRVESENDDDSAVVLENVFLHDESDYEVVIRLRADALPKHDMVLSSSRNKKNKKSTTTSAAAGWQAMEPEDTPEESKKSRAVLKGIPKSVIQVRGAAAVRKELLIEFDPVPLYVSLLEDRFGAVAVPCADYLGGTSVGLKLRGPALQPTGNLRPEAAHATKPLDGVFPKSFDESLVVVPDLEAVAADCLVLGKGLVEKVEFKSNI